MKIKLCSIVFIITFLIFNVNAQKKSLELWYSKPATDWMSQAMPIGNGYMGAMIFGGTAIEQIQFSEKTLWAGGPRSHSNYNFGLKNEAPYTYLQEVRNLLNQGKFDTADEIVKAKFSGSINAIPKSSYGDFGAQQTMADMYLESDIYGVIKNYKRCINITKGLVEVKFEADNTNFKRTYFANYPQNIMVYNFKNSKPINSRLKLQCPHEKINISYIKSHLYLNGEVASNKQQFEMALHIKSDGKVHFSNSILFIDGATYITIIQTAATDYKNQYPDYIGRKYQADNSLTLKKIYKENYSSLLQKHLHDYQVLMQRVSLDLGSDSILEKMPTDERLLNYSKYKNDRSLESLVYQYGRYLLIAASRPKTLPANLQACWNNSTNPPWANDYHLNINLQMLYWPAESTNLSECHESLLHYISSLEKPGTKTAKHFFNASGWTANTMNNIFGYTAIGWGIPWGYFPAGAAWLCSHLWQHYEYNLDKKYLSNHAYPLMKSAALFWLDYLSKDENGHLVSSPSYSPEHGTISNGASMDHEIVSELFNNCIKAGQTLKQDEQFITMLKLKIDSILPLKIGKHGQLQEWKQDIDDMSNTHRHVSHLYALYPGNQISPQQTPALAKAARTSLEARGDQGTGWSLAWKINFWARLLDGNRAHTLLQNFINPINTNQSDKTKNNYTTHGGLYDNLLCAHPPFQLDGNMGVVAGITEMLLQSNTKNIFLLPALPQIWHKGSIKGIKAIGNYTINLSWNKNTIEVANITTTATQLCTIFSKTPIQLIHVKGNILSQKKGEIYVLTFNANRNKQYNITAY